MLEIYIIQNSVLWAKVPSIEVIVTHPQPTQHPPYTDRARNYGK